MREPSLHWPGCTHCGVGGAHSFGRPQFCRYRLCCGHAGNASVLHAVVAQMRHEGHQITALIPAFDGADAHAGETETSLMLAIDPTAVDMTQAVAGCVEPLRDVLDLMRRGGVATVSANGILGDPTSASAENGRRLLAELGEQASVIADRLGTSRAT
ncbi:MAG: creatininase family protein [Acidimicrobiales bacterium]